MQKFKYKGQTIVASTKAKAIHKIVASNKANKVKADSSFDLWNNDFDVESIYKRVIKELKNRFSDDIGVDIEGEDWDNDTYYCKLMFSGLALNTNGNGIPKDFASVAQEWVDNNDSTEEDYEGDLVLKDMTIGIKLDIDSGEVFTDEEDEDGEKILDKNGCYRIRIEPVLYDDSVTRRRIKFGEEKEIKLEVKLGAVKIVKDICDFVGEYLEDSKFIE